MINFSSNLAVLFPLGSCLYIAMRLSDGRVDGKGGGWARAMVYSITSLLITLSLAGILFRVGPVSLIWLFVSGFLCLLIWIKSRAINRSLMFHSFAAVSSNISRERMAADFMEHNSGFVASKAQRFLQAIAVGLDWPKAMEVSEIAASTSEIFSNRCLAKYGPNIDREICPALDPLRIQAETERLLARLMSVPWAMMGFPAVILIVWLIIPTFKEMFEEFGLQLPNSMLSFIALSDLAVNTSLGSLLFLSMLGLMVIAGGIVLAWLFPKAIWSSPFRWFVMPYFRTLGLTAVAITLRRERDFSAACKMAAELLPMWAIKDRLDAAAGFHSQGMSPDRALGKSGLLKYVEADVLSASVQSHSFPWALEQVAISATERMLRLYSILIQLFIVVMILFFAVLFGWLAIGVIESLASLIMHST